MKEDQPAKDGARLPQSSMTPGPPPRLAPSPPISNWLLAGAMLLVAVVTGTLLFVLVRIAQAPTPSPTPGGLVAPSASVQIEAIRTALTAGAGTGGAIALFLAFRRQRHIEETTVMTHEATLAAERDRRADLEQREAAAHDVAEDARERRITELYSRAADQLGSDKAPVRLAGLYALERLGESNKALRQTLADLFCAYLRMPPEVDPSASETQSSSVGDVDVSSAVSYSHEEQQVRQAAQLILARRLVMPTTKQVEGESWGALRIDLSGAKLVSAEFPSVDLSAARLSYADLRGAQFSESNFSLAMLDGVRLSRSDLSECDFSDASIYRAALDQCDIQESNFREAALYGTDLTGSDLSGSDFRNASLNSVKLANSELAGASFVSSELIEADLDGASLVRVDFSNARLEGASFRGAVVEGAVFTGARLARADFTDVDLALAVDLPEAIRLASSR